MGFQLDVQAVKDHVERLYPKGAYEAKIVSCEEQLGKSSGRPMLKIQVEIADTIPSGGEIDTEEFKDPIGQKMTTYQCLPVEGDKPNTKDMFNGQLKKLITYSNAEVSDTEINGDDFLNMYVGVTIGHQKINKDDPNSALRAELTGWAALPE